MSRISVTDNIDLFLERLFNTLSIEKRSIHHGDFSMMINCFRHRATELRQKASRMAPDDRKGSRIAVSKASIYDAVANILQVELDGF